MVDPGLRGLEEAFEMEDRDWPIGPIEIPIWAIFTLLEEDRLLIGTENLLAWIVTECVGVEGYLLNFIIIIIQ